MPAPKVPTAEFLELWATHKSAARVAEALGVDERAVYKRRRALEAKVGVQLHASDLAKSQFYKHLSPKEHPHRKHLEVGDGVVLVFSDAHFWPGVRTTAFRALLQFIKELKPRAIICNGDAFDGASISRFPRIGWDSKPTVQEELKACEDRLGEIEAKANGARLLWPVGNHDARFATRLAANAPEYQGVKGFELKDHFPKWEPCWSTWINGDVVVKHRYKGGVHATHANVVGAGKTIVTGHLHSLKVTPYDDYNPRTRWGVDTGTLAEADGPQFIDYSEDNPKNYRSGFAVLTFHRGRLLWPELVHVVDENTVDFRGHAIDVPQ